MLSSILSNFLTTWLRFMLLSRCLPDHREEAFRAEEERGADPTTNGCGEKVEEFLFMPFREEAVRHLFDCTGHKANAQPNQHGRQGILEKIDLREGYVDKPDRNKREPQSTQQM